MKKHKLIAKNPSFNGKLSRVEFIKGVGITECKFTANYLSAVFNINIEIIEENEEDIEQKTTKIEEEKEGFKCEICGKTLLSERGLALHKSRMHGGDE